ASGFETVGLRQQSLTFLRLEGITASVAHRASGLAKALSSFGAADILEDATSVPIWASVCDVHPFAADGALGAWPVWRIVCPPASGGALGRDLAREAEAEAIYDWGGGLIWVALPSMSDLQAALLRQRVNATGGHATLIRASEEVRQKVDVFHPQAAALAS